MRSTARWLATVSVWALICSPGALRGDDHTGHEDLPPGPIRDRHELMEEQGAQAEEINEAFSIGSEGFDTGIIQRAAKGIAMSAHRIPSLFPKGSTDPKSRALPAIWEGQNWDKFVALAKQLEEQANSLSAAAGAEDDENLKEKSQKMFATCKSCHDQFRRPKDDKKKGS